MRLAVTGRWVRMGSIRCCGGVAAGWVSEIARDSAPGPYDRLNRPPSTISPGVGRRRRPIDGLWISQADSYVA
jgi:hypothetical protein